jgi:zinc protease
MQTTHIEFLIFIVVLGIATQLACTKPKPSTATDAAASPSPNQPALVDQIFARYTEAVGGQEAIDRVTSYKTKGTFELLGRKGSIEIWGKDPNKNLTVIEFPIVGTVKKGFDGETQWAQTPAGTVSDSSEQEIAEVERDAEIYRAGKIKSLYEKVKVESKARLGGRDVYMVEGVPAKGPSEKLFFDIENGLLVRWDMARKHPKRGIVFVKVHLSDYKDVDGVKVPHKVRFAFESFSFTITVDELQHNVAIDDTVFKKP